MDRDKRNWRPLQFDEIAASTTKRSAIHDFVVSPSHRLLSLRRQTEDQRPCFSRGFRSTRAEAMDWDSLDRSSPPPGKIRAVAQ